MAGNTHSTEQHSSQSNQAPRINHPKLKESKILGESDIIRSTITTQQQSDYQQWEQKLNKTANIDDEVILLPKAYQFMQKAFCGSACTIQIDYDNYPYILADQLHNRRAVNRYFSEPELWYLLYSLVTAAHDFMKLGEKIGDVRPENIFINEEGHIKVSNLFSWPGQVTNYIKTVYDHQRTYLSPEQADAAREGKNQSYIDKYKAETFSIGLTVMETALIRDLDYLYQQNNALDLGRYSSLLKQWWAFKYPHLDETNNTTRLQDYSEIFKLVIAQMCELKPEDRVTSDQVYSWLKKYHEEINELKGFVPGLPPIRNRDRYANFVRKWENQPTVGGNNYNPNQKVNQGLPTQGGNNFVGRDPYLQHFRTYANPNNVPPYSQNPAYNNLQPGYQNQPPIHTQIAPNANHNEVYPSTYSNNMARLPINTNTNTTINNYNPYTQQAQNYRAVQPQFVNPPENQYQLYGQNQPKMQYGPPPSITTATTADNKYQFYSGSTQMPTTFQSQPLQKNDQFILPQPQANQYKFTAPTTQNQTTTTTANNYSNFGKNINATEARSIQFLRQVDQKLNKLKQQAI